ncbi:CHAT domain-containing protein [Actinokineospora diospyrosa]|uniref:CHAT domain-containing protein n=1 Tax=Actinokineospora diospyrosa TaxID=103728 RepID=A0ABT1I9B8_9PSEU|nr:CHAT domain-containing protein [Actinokineospora diospyrosa]MCP2269222.1 CHAT domain-containing protein [Actinokineospora diospyrosa]
MSVYATSLILAGRLARSRRLPQEGDALPGWVRRLAGRLDTLSDNESLAESVSLEASELEGYLTGLRLLADRDTGNAGFSFARSALMRIMREHRLARVPLPRDRPLAKVYELLGRQYLRFGDWKMAADCYGHASLYWQRPRQVRRTFSMLVLCYLLDGNRGEAAEMLALIEGDGSGPPKHFLRVSRKLVDSTSDLRDEVARFPLTRPMGTVAHGYLAALTASRLAGDGHLAEALELLDDVAVHLSSKKATDAVVAELDQRKANVLLALGRYAQSREVALSAWRTLDAARYEPCSFDQREALWRRIAPARYAALRASVALGEGEVVAELIEKCRLQSLIAAEVEVELKGKEKHEKSTAQGGVQATTQGATTKEELHAGKSIFAAINDAYNGTLLLQPAATTFDTTALPEGAFWSTQIENGMLFWFLAVDGRHLAHGMEDLRDYPRLQPVLRALAGYSGAADPRLWQLPPYTPQAGDYYEPVRHMADWNSPEELIMSSTLGEVLPEPLVSLLLAADRRGPLELTLSPARELAAVLWPIIVVPGTGDRLVERAVLRMWTSSVIENVRAGRPRPPAGHPSPFLLACENPDGTLRERPAPNIVHRASTVLAGEAATKDALLAALHNIGPGTPGVFFYTGHALHDSDPAYSALPLAGKDVIQSGELFGKFDDGTPFLPMPSRVILSCCSSSGNSLLGGETLGLAAGMLQSGAHQVIATGVDVFDSSFTQAFDDLLVEGMTQPDVDAGVLLRATHLRMLKEWKTYSLRGGSSFTEDFTDPHPVIWAAYQAY